MEFKVGDKVIMSKTCSSNELGFIGYNEVGTIIRITDNEDFKYFVKWNKAGHGSYYDHDELQLYTSLTKVLYGF